MREPCTCGCPHCSRCQFQAVLDEVEYHTEQRRAEQECPCSPPPCPSCAAKDAERLEKVRCCKPGVESCAKQWEANHQRRILEEHGLAEEFPFGCDSIDSVAEALLEARAEIARLRHKADAVDWLLGCAYLWREGSPVIPADNWQIFVKWCGGNPPDWAKQTAPPTGA